jgi:tryptophan-rich sensory protein
MNLNIEDIVYIILPSIICYSVTAFCKIGKASGNTVKFRPPAEIFSIIWPFLFILFGVSWALAMRNSDNKILCFSLYMLLTISLGLWIYIYGCRKSIKVASWILILSIIFSLMSFTQGNEISKILIAPLIGWCIFAQLMNITEVEKI